MWSSNGILICFEDIVAPWFASRRASRPSSWNSSSSYSVFRACGICSSIDSSLAGLDCGMTDVPQLLQSRKTVTWTATGREGTAPWSSRKPPSAFLRRAAKPRLRKDGAASRNPKCTPRVRGSRGTLLIDQPLCLIDSICSQYCCSRVASSSSLEAAPRILSAALLKPCSL